LNPITPAAPVTQLTEEESLFRESVRRFAQDEVAPLVRRMDEDQQMDSALVRKLFALGLMGIEVPEEFGGSGGTFFDAVLAVETLSQVDPAVALLVDVHNTLVVNALMRWGTPEQKQKYLPRLATDTVGAYALSEAGSGSDAFALQTRADKRGGEYVLTGRKLWISNAKEAGLFIVFATVDASAGYKGITAFLVENGTTGFTVGRKEDKLGIRASSTCELILEGCAVPAGIGRSGQRLQDRDGVVEWRAHRHWRADAWAGRRGVGPCREARQGAEAIRQGPRRVPGHAISAWGDGHGH